MEVTIATSHGVLRLNAPSLEVARLLASVHGFHVDIEPGAPGHCSLKALHVRTGACLAFSGTSVQDAAEKLIKGLVHE